MYRGWYCGPGASKKKQWGKQESTTQPMGVIAWPCWVTWSVCPHSQVVVRSVPLNWLVFIAVFRVPCILDVNGFDFSYKSPILLLPSHTISIIHHLLQLHNPTLESVEEERSKDQGIFNYFFKVVRSCHLGW